MLESVGSFFFIEKNYNLVDIDFQGLTTVTTSFFIKNNAKLTKVISPLLKSTEFITIEKNNDNLGNLDLQGLTTVTNYIRIKQNPTLVSTDLSMLTTVALTFRIEATKTSQRKVT